MLEVPEITPTVMKKLLASFLCLFIFPYLIFPLLVISTRGCEGEEEEKLAAKER